MRVGARTSTVGDEPLTIYVQALTVLVGEPPEVVVTDFVARADQWTVPEHTHWGLGREPTMHS